jgi:hypothetical protein
MMGGDISSKANREAWERYRAERGIKSPFVSLAEVAGLPPPGGPDDYGSEDNHAEWRRLNGLGC